MDEVIPISERIGPGGFPRFVVMDKVLFAIKKVETIISVIFLVFIVCLVFIAALLRWFGIPVAWSIDVAQLLLGWVVFLGADVALKNDSHIGVDMFINMLPVRMRKIILFVDYLVMTLFLVSVSVYGIYLSVANYQRLFNTLQISYSYATMSVPVGCILMQLTMAEKIKTVFTMSGTHISDSDKTTD